jgi:murein DD-endopeptidase MepM/ murein hydrolase activator NlpD
VTPDRRYYFPVQPPKIASYANEHHDYPAADIFTPIGSPVLAVTNGVVDEVSRVDRWERRTNDGAYRGGLWVTFIGDDGVRYHTSHLSAVVDGIEPGGRVHAGQIIGYSGNTGNATLTPPHVHFGISSPTYPGDWMVRRGQVWPYLYLKAWTRGEDVTPKVP